MPRLRVRVPLSPPVVLILGVPIPLKAPILNLNRGFFIFSNDPLCSNKAWGSRTNFGTRNGTRATAGLVHDPKQASRQLRALAGRPGITRGGQINGGGGAAS